jgi:rifampicin phosphotransferase
MEPRVLTYAQAYGAGPGIGGGKGWNLARLARYGFPVPPGCTLTVDVYRELMSHPPLPDLTGSLAEVVAEEAGSDGVIARLDDVRAEIARAPVPEAALDELEACLASMGLHGAPLAVRSSAGAEDGSEASFAGIHESVLNVTGREPIRDAIRTCFASLWTPRALAYRRRWGVDDRECPCAVVVCRMVEQAHGDAPLSAGVAFTCDPQTGRRDLVIVNAAAGQGDLLVRGAVQPEPYAVRRGVIDWEVIDSPAIRGRGSSPQAPEESRVLADDRLIELAELSLRVHWALGDGQDPQDIEWAHDGERFWLVQARPVTRVPRASFPAVADQPLHWSNANVKEVLPGVMTPLSWSMVQAAVSHCMLTTQHAAGYEVPPGLELLRRFSGRAYLDLTGLQWAFYDALGSKPADINRDLGGLQPEIDVGPDDPLRGPDGPRRRKAQRKLLARLWRFDRELAPQMARLHDQVRETRGADLARLSLAELGCELTRWQEISEEFAPGFQLANAFNGLCMYSLKPLLGWLTGSDGTGLFSRLLAGTGGVTTAEQGYRLRDLAEVARTDPAALAWLRGSSGEAPRPWSGDPHSWERLGPDSPFRRKFAEYLHDFGHRSEFEYEVAHPRWIDDPSFLMEQVRWHLDAPAAEDPRLAAARVRRTVEDELRRATWVLRPLVFWLVAQARRGMALRESSKSALVATREPVRRIVCELGKRLVSADKLDDPGDVFFLTSVDLEAYLAGRWDGEGARALAADRRAQVRAWERETPPDVITWPADQSSWGVSRAASAVVPDLHRETHESLTMGRWRGVPVAPGRAAGPARVLLSPLDGHRLSRGDVLVAPSTDPGWTPLFLRAGAVVMETGGYLSHGAIVAREFGLPAVAGLPGILVQVADGEQLVVDGDEGVVARSAGDARRGPDGRESHRTSPAASTREPLLR